MYSRLRVRRYMLLASACIGVGFVSLGDAKADDVQADQLDGSADQFEQLSTAEQDALDAEQAKRAATSKVDAEAPLSGTDIAFMRLSEMDPSDTVQVTFALSPLVVQDFEALALFEGLERDALLETEIQKNELVRELAEGVLRDGGAKRVWSNWLGNLVHADVRVSSVEGMFVDVGAVGLSLRRAYPVNFGSVSYDGAEVGEAVRSDVFKAAGYDGNQGHNGSSTGAVHVGVVEFSGYTLDSNVLHRTHVGWKDFATGSSNRLKVVSRCEVGSGSSAVCTPSGEAGSDKHGTRVTWVLAGSIEQGQDPAYGLAPQRTQRSGVTSESEMHYWMVSEEFDYGGPLDAANYVVAIEDAVVKNVDVLNFSNGLLGDTSQQAALLDHVCQPNDNFAGINEAIRAANTAGVLMVGAAGNFTGQPTGYGGTFTSRDCTVTLPNMRPEVLTVGATTTQASTYVGEGIRPSSSAGGVPMTVSGASGTQTTTAVDVIAPGAVTLYFKPTITSGYSSYENQSQPGGTSYSSPIVAGSAANVKDMLENNGWGYSNGIPGRMKAAMMMMGDFFQTKSGPTVRGGTGRLQAHINSSADLGSSFNTWRMGSFSISDGTVAYINVASGAPIPSGARGVKAAIHWNEDDYTDVADIILSIEDSCTGGGTLISNSSFSLTKAVKATDTDGIVGKCLRLKVTAVSTPEVFIGGPHESRTVYYALYGYSSNVGTH